MFFVGVSTTGVYCRPVCRLRTPGRDRCTFYPDAASAEAAGFRPCLRCRPELAAPGAAPRRSGRAPGQCGGSAHRRGCAHRRQRRSPGRRAGRSSRQLHRDRSRIRSEPARARADALGSCSPSSVNGYAAEGDRRGVCQRLRQVRQFNRQFRQQYRLNPLGAAQAPECQRGHRACLASAAAGLVTASAFWPGARRRHRTPRASATTAASGSVSTAASSWPSHWAIGWAPRCRPRCPRCCPSCARLRRLFDLDGTRAPPTRS